MTTTAPILFNYNIDDTTIIGGSVKNAPNAIFSGNFTLSVTYKDGVPIIQVQSSTLQTDTFGTSTTNSTAQHTGVVDSKFDAFFTNVTPCSSYTAINSSSDHNGVLVVTNATTHTVTMTFDAPATYTTGLGTNATDYNRVVFSFRDDSLFTPATTDNVSKDINVTDLSQTYWTSNGCGGMLNSALAVNDKVEFDESIPCYVQGTLIATVNGLVAVEDLQPGDQVLTVEGKVEPVIWLGHHTIHCQRQVKAEKAYPVCIQKDAFETNVPNRDLYLSPDHSIYIDGVMIPAFCLLNGLTILQARTEQLVTYYHVELPSHQAIYAEGLMAESYLETSAQNRNFFRASTDRSNVHPIASQYPPCPEGVQAWRHIWDTQGYGKLTMSGPILEAVKARLQSRAEQLLNLFKIAA